MRLMSMAYPRSMECPRGGMPRSGLLLLALLEGRAFACSSGWTSYSSACYYFESSSSTYTAAQSACEALDSRASLACVNSATENDWLASEADTNGLSGAWIGYTDSVSEGTWVWEDSTCTSSYENWDTNEPNGDDCAKLQVGSDTSWKDRPCTSTYGYICEYDNDGSPTQRPTAAPASSTDGGGGGGGDDDDNDDDDRSASQNLWFSVAFGLAFILMVIGATYVVLRRNRRLGHRLCPSRQGLNGHTATIELGAVEPRTTPVVASRIHSPHRSMALAEAHISRQPGPVHAVVVGMNDEPDFGPVSSSASSVDGGVNRSPRQALPAATKVESAATYSNV
jgi:hypothetical protein